MCCNCRALLAVVKKKFKNDNIVIPGSTLRAIFIPKTLMHKVE